MSPCLQCPFRWIYLVSLLLTRFHVYYLLALSETQAQVLGFQWNINSERAAQAYHCMEFEKDNCPGRLLRGLRSAFDQSPSLTKYIQNR